MHLYNYIVGVLCYYITTIREGNKTKNLPNKTKIIRQGQSKKPERINTMTNVSTSTSVRFTLNFAAKTIVGTKASFDKASKASGPVYMELMALIEKHPTFGFEVKAPKEPSKPKQTYKGMDIAFILDFLTANDDTITLKTVNDVIAYADKMGMSKYPLAKRVLFETYDSFDFTNAKELVNEYRYQQTRKQADEMAAKIAALAA